MDKINKKWICPSRIHLLHNPFSSPSIEKLCTSSKIKSAGMIYALRVGKFMQMCVVLYCHNIFHFTFTQTSWYMQVSKCD